MVVTKRMYQKKKMAAWENLAQGIIIVMAILHWGCEGVLYYYTCPKISISGT